jgi:aerobic carbon-monoxide dehydrogenase medium subunit
MYPPAFTYHAPETLDATVALLAELGAGAKLLAGGASLVALMKLRLVEPTDIVDLRRVPGLGTIELLDGRVRIGAMVRQADLLTSPVARAIPIFADACAVIADPSVRNVGTIGGNLAHGDPANDHPAIMLALGATIQVHGPRGDRAIAAADFNVDLLQVALEPDEVLTAIDVPTPAPGQGTAYVKFERQVGDFAIAAAAAVITLDGDRVVDARVTFTNLGPTPIRSRAIEAALSGRAADTATIAAATRELVEIDPWADVRATAEVKRSMARAAAERAIGRAVARAREGIEA